MTPFQILTLSVIGASALIVTVAVVTVGGRILRGQQKMSDTNAQVVTDIHQMTTDLATLRTNVAAVKARIDALVTAGTIPANVAAELHAAVGEVQADNAALAELNPSDPNAPAA